MIISLCHTKMGREKTAILLGIPHFDQNLVFLLILCLAYIKCVPWNCITARLFTYLNCNRCKVFLHKCKFLALNFVITNERKQGLNQFVRKLGQGIIKKKIRHSMLTKIKYIYIMCSDTLPTSVERWDSKKKYNINYSTALVPNETRSTNLVRSEDHVQQNIQWSCSYCKKTRPSPNKIKLSLNR